MRLHCILLLALSIIAPHAGGEPRPVIDVHLHAGPKDWNGPGAPADPANKDQLRDILSQMDRHNVRLAVISGPMDFVVYWKKEAPTRFIASVMFPCDGGRAPLGGRQCFPSNSDLPNIDWLRNQYSKGSLGAMGEIVTQYAGLSSADVSLEPYYGIAEEFSMPVGVHTGLSYPGTPYTCCPKFRAALGRPLLLEEVLIRHPRLQLYAMHAGYPYREEMIALMVVYPQVHIDVSAISYLMPRALFHEYLRQLIEHGFGKRILFGSDGFPLAASIEAIESAGFLTEEQRSDIFCANAARFFRLDAGALCKRAGD